MTDAQGELDAPVVLAKIEIVYQIRPGGQPDVQVWWDDSTAHEDADDRMLLQFMGMLTFAEKTIWAATVHGEH